MLESLVQAKTVHEANAVLPLKMKRIFAMSFSPDYCRKWTLSLRVVWVRGR